MAHIQLTKLLAESKLSELQSKFPNINIDVLRKLLSFKLFSVSRFNSDIRKTHLPEWKSEKYDIMEINERVARFFLHKIAEQLGIAPQEIDWRNKSKNSHSLFQMTMYCGDVHICTNPFIYTLMINTMLY